MKFSVLLPTRNGGPQLRYSIKSVLSQAERDLELIISDNASEQSTAAAISGFLDDPRVKYIRQLKPLPVTDNWNATLDAMTGDYFVMLGDDDCLMPGYFAKAREWLAQYSYPDCIRYRAYLFIHSQSLGDASRWYCDDWDSDMSVTGEVPAPVREKLARAIYSLRTGFIANSQLMLVSKGVSREFKGGFYRPPFPDSYSTLGLLLKAKRFVFEPDRLAVVGVSPKSAGYHHFNRKDEDFRRYLGLEASQIPEPRRALIEFQIQALEKVKEEFKPLLDGLTRDRASLARMETLDQCRAYALGSSNLSNIFRVASELNWRDRVSYLLPRLGYQAARRVRRKLTGRPTAAEVLFPNCKPFAGKDIGEFAEQVLVSRSAA
jgi:glycosyltransferase involved in cell wall biosynthesis